VKHDPAKLAARQTAFRTRMDAATAEIDAKITVLQAERGRAIAAVIAEHTTFVGLLGRPEPRVLPLRLLRDQEREPALRHGPDHPQ
jgi:hypothetical protein